MLLMRGDCSIRMQEIETGSVDLVVTSPPYDNLRNYNRKYKGFDFEKIANQLNRCLCAGGVIVWVVADQTIKGSETGTSFRQALYFKSIGLNLHDTMIFKKKNSMPLNHNRYEQCFEFMFIFSKGKPKTFNPIKVPCKLAGSESFGKSKFYKTSDDVLTNRKQKNEVKTDKIKLNIWEYITGSLSPGAKYKHPAKFPLGLAIDHVLSWSNINDIVMDPFMGSGTTGIACLNTKRNFIGIEKDENYFQIAKERIEEGNYNQSR